MPIKDMEPPTAEQQILVAEELPSSSALPDIEPYLRDVLMETNPHTGVQRYARRFTLDTAKQFLLDCPRVPVYVPPDTTEEMSNPSRAWTIIVTWNGVRMVVPKCRQALVPIPIAEILAQRAKPLRTAQAQERSIYVTEITDGGDGPEITAA